MTEEEAIKILTTGFHTKSSLADMWDKCADEKFKKHYSKYLLDQKIKQDAKDHFSNISFKKDETWENIHSHISENISDFYEDRQDVIDRQELKYKDEFMTLIRYNSFGIEKATYFLNEKLTYDEIIDKVSKEYKKLIAIIEDISNEDIRDFRYNEDRRSITWKAIHHLHRVIKDDEIVEIRKDASFKEVAKKSFSIPKKVVDYIEKDKDFKELSNMEGVLLFMIFKNRVNDEYEFHIKKNFLVNILKSKNYVFLRKKMRNLYRNTNFFQMISETKKTYFFRINQSKLNNQKIIIKKDIKVYKKSEVQAICFINSHKIYDHQFKKKLGDFFKMFSFTKYAKINRKFFLNSIKNVLGIFNRFKAKIKLLDSELQLNSKFLTENWKKALIFKF